jgi:hypothetical protein
MINRRSFLSSISSLPLVGGLASLVNAEAQPYINRKICFQYFGKLDLSIKDERCTFDIFLASCNSDYVSLVKRWNWPNGKDIDMCELRRHIEKQYEYWHMHRVMCDPAQTVLLAQELEQAGIRVEMQTVRSDKPLRRPNRTAPLTNEELRRIAAKNPPSPEWLNGEESV